MSHAVPRRLLAAAMATGVSAFAFAGTAPPAAATVVPVDPPAIVRPVDGDTATTATPTFSGDGLPGGIVELNITCGDETWSGSTEVDADGGWAFTPAQGLPNGVCSVAAVQSVNGTTSAQTDALAFTVDVASADVAGIESGDESGGGGGNGDLPDTGAAANPVVLTAGLVLLGLGVALYASTRRHTTG